MKRLFTLFLLMENALALAQPAINPARPRVYADSARLADLQLCISAPGECQTTWNSFMTAYDGWWINDPELYLLGTDSTLWTWNWGSQWAKDEAVFTVFIYRMTGDPLALKRCRFIAQKVIDTVATADFANMEWYAKEDLLRRLSDAADVLLDWTHDDLPAPLRQQLAQAMYSRTREFMHTFIYSTAGNSYVSSHNAWNNVFCNQDALALFGADGLTPEQNDTVWQWYTDVLDKWDNGFMPCYAHYRDTAGGWNWGAAYSMWSLVDQFQLFENMRIATGYDYYTQQPWVHNSINQYWYFIQPDGLTLHLGDGLARLRGDRVVHLHARYFSDPRSQWLSQQLALPTATPNTIDKFDKLLYRDFSASAVSHPNPHLHWYSAPVGLSVARSSWADDATMVSFFNSPSKRAAHEHRDNNSFTIFKHAPLLIDAGHYDSYNTAHYRDYYSRTVAHNSICVYDSTESYTAFGQAASNDGGQIESPALQNYDQIFLPENQRGQWVKYATDQSTYQYTIADAELSYDTTKVKKFRRRTLFLPPNRYIVLDHVILKGVGTAQRDAFWTGHFQNMPSVSGTMTNAEVPGHIESFNGTDVVATNGAGKVAMRTLLPQNPNITRIGGDGYEYWADGQDHPTTVTPDTNIYTPGNWRVEVRSPVENDTLIFLHTFAIGDTGAVVEAGGTVYMSEQSIGVDWNDTIYFFARNGEVDVCEHRLDSIPGLGGRFVNLAFVDLQTDMSYYYYYQVTNSSDFSGYFWTNWPDSIEHEFGIFEPGYSNVWLQCDREAVDERPINANLLLIPNPTTGRFKAELPAQIQGGTATVTDLMGRAVLQQAFAGNRLELDLSNYAPGMYSVRVAGNDGQVMSGKVVVTSE
jgi:hypothetical protein